MESATLAHAKAAFSTHSWHDAYAAFTALDARTPLEPEDLDRLATAAYLVGRDEASVAARTRAHAAYLDRGDPIRAAGAAFWLAFTIIDNPSQRAQAEGWLARARRLLDETSEACPERGWVLCATGYLRITERDVAAARDAFSHAAEIGARFQDRSLVALARHGHGRCLLALGDAAAGLTLLDEVMVGVTSGEIAPMVAGVVYCSVISACHDLFDWRRAQEWTMALQAWCATQPDLVPFRGYCLIRRSELLQLHGEWAEAAEEARRACERAGEGTRRPELGAAYYQLAEMHRLRGELAAAEEAYRLASQAGRKPYPGFALLRLAQGHIDAADRSIRLALQEAREGKARVPLLRAAVEISLARQDVDSARTAAEELADLAGRLESIFMRAVSAQASGEVALAQREAARALNHLRAALTSWQELDARFEMARVRVSMGLACRQLGDLEGAQLELQGAQETLERLGAPSEVSRVSALTSEPPPASGGLTGREVEVLRLIATGATNRAIALRLGISEKTVARHISNIFTKLDLTSRAAATAYAYEHRLV